MKTIIFVVVIIALATLAYIYLTQPPNLESTLEEARESGTLIARYWLDQAKQDNLENMKKASSGAALNQTSGMLETIHQAERSAGEEFTDYSLFSMGGGGALKAVLASDSGVLMQMTLMMKEKDGKWCVVRISGD